MKTLNRIILSFVFLCLHFSSFAWWGPNGHRIVGEIAEKHLTKKALKAIHEILGNESIGMAANWADFIKSDSSFDYISAWHYINLKPALSYDDFNTAIENDTTANAYTKINFLVSKLKNRTLEKDKKLMYLRLLIHIAGDVHQPMHVSHAEDLGGNKIKLIWFNESTNLHSLWDEKLIDFQKLSYSEYASALDHCTKQQISEWQKQPVKEWFYESYKIAEQLYSEINKPDPKLSYRYNFDHIDILNQQLVKGGIHLAGLLNEIFG